MSREPAGVALALAPRLLRAPSLGAAPRRALEAATDPAALALAARAAAEALHLKWSEKGWVCVVLVVHRELRLMARDGRGGSGVSFHAWPRLSLILDLVCCLLERAAAAYCDTTSPADRNVGSWNYFLYANVVPELDQRGLWPEEQNLWLVGSDALLRATPVVQLALPGAIPIWTASIHDARLMMLDAGMGPDNGPPQGLRPFQQVWSSTSDLESLTLPPPHDFPLPTRAGDMCGYIPCMLCLDPVKQTAFRFFMRTQTGGPCNYTVYLYTSAPMFFVITGAALPCANKANDGGPPGTVPFCAVARRVWRLDGELGSVPDLQVQQMLCRYASDRSQTPSVYLVTGPGVADSHAVVSLRFHFNLVVDGAGNDPPLRVVHELLVCDCSGGVAMPLASLRRAAAGADSRVGDLPAYIEVLLRSYHHCLHTQRVQADLLAKDLQHRVPLGVLRCVSLRSKCCADNACLRAHMGSYLLPLRPADGEAEQDPDYYSLFVGMAGRAAKVFCWDGADSWAFLAGVPGYPRLARCQNAFDCDGHDCAHERKFKRIAEAGYVQYPDLQSCATASFAGRWINEAATPAGPGEEPAPYAPMERPKSTTPIPPRLPDDTVCYVKELDLCCTRWLTNPSGAGPLDASFFKLTGDGVVLWDLSCSVEGCGYAVQPDFSSMMSATLYIWLGWGLRARGLSSFSHRVHCIPFSSGAVPASYCRGLCEVHGLCDFDGIKIGVLNLNGSALVMLNVLSFAEDVTITSRSSLFSAFRALDQRLLDVSDTGPYFLSRELLRQAYWAYLLLRVAFEDAQPRIAAGFSCDICGVSPPAMIVDGVAIGKCC